MDHNLCDTRAERAMELQTAEFISNNQASLTNRVCLLIFPVVSCWAWPPSPAVDGSPKALQGISIAKTWTPLPTSAGLKVNFGEQTPIKRRVRVSVREQLGLDHDGLVDRAFL